MFSFFSKFFSRSKSSATLKVSGELDYDKAIILDAESLAEQGIVNAYRELLPELNKYVKHPAELEELIDCDLPSYTVRCGGHDYLIYSAQEPGTEEESWGRATYFFFHLVNNQLAEASVRLYAINSGNDLGGLFLTPEQAIAAQQNLPRRLDWPYLPQLSPPMYGQNI